MFIVFLGNHRLEIIVYFCLCRAHMCCCTLWIWSCWKATPVLAAKAGSPINPISLSLALSLSYTRTHTFACMHAHTNTSTHAYTHMEVQAQMVTCSLVQTKAAFMCVLPGLGWPEHRTPERVWELLILIHSYTAATEPYKHIQTAHWHKLTGVWMCNPAVCMQNYLNFTYIYVKLVTWELKEWIIT